MSLTINHNLMAINTARNLSTHYGSLGVSTRRLSSGLRIGTAADDAAGLAVREIMRADIASLGQGIRNANDAISMIQVADGALQIIDEKLIRMKELATQAATGTYVSDQRLIIDSEFQAMKAEIDRIANSTEFNGIKLLERTVNRSSISTTTTVTGDPIPVLSPWVNIWNYDTIGNVSDTGVNPAAERSLSNSTGELTFDVMGFANGLGTLTQDGSGNIAITPGLFNVRTVYEIRRAFDDATDAEPSLAGISFDDAIDMLFQNPSLIANFSNSKMLLFVNDVSVGFQYPQSYSNQNIKMLINTGYDSGIPSPDDIVTLQIDSTSGHNISFFLAFLSYETLMININGTNNEKMETGFLDLSGNTRASQAQTTILGSQHVVDDIIVHFGKKYNSSEDYYSIEIESATASSLGIGKSHVQTQDVAQEAITDISSAIITKDKIRASLGATQNRLENTITNLQIQAENLQAAESRISDADMAKEMTEFVKSQILTQSATAMLAQANTLPEMALQLIQGQS